MIIVTRDEIRVDWRKSDVVEGLSDAIRNGRRDVRRPGNSAARERCPYSPSNAPLQSPHLCPALLPFRPLGTSLQCKPGHPVDWCKVRHAYQLFAPKSRQLVSRKGVGLVRSSGRDRESSRTYGDGLPRVGEFWTKTKFNITLLLFRISKITKTPSSLNL